MIVILNVFTLKTVTSTSIIFAINQIIFLRHFAASHFRISNCAVTERTRGGDLQKIFLVIFIGTIIPQFVDLEICPCFQQSKRNNSPELREIMILERSSQ